MFLQTQGITKEFGKLRAVNNVTLEIKKGDIHAIIGPNGAGKSTYFNLVTGYHRATSGKVLFRDKEITHLPAYSRCNLGITRSFQRQTR
jgi:branched-chain amino acid transport system ATP-binding protein